MIRVHVTLHKRRKQKTVCIHKPAALGPVRSCLVIPSGKETYLEAVEETIELLRGEETHEGGEHVLDVLDNGLVFAHLGLPDLVQVFQTEFAHLNKELDDSGDLLHVLRLVEVLAQEQGEHLQGAGKEVC